MEYKPSLYEGNVLTLDLETTNILKGNPSYGNRIVCAVYYTEGRVHYVTDNITEQLRCAVEQCDILVCHNAKFELKWLLHLGIDITHLSIVDTMLVEHTLQGNGKDALALGKCCERYSLPTKDMYIDILMDNGVCPSEMPSDMLLSRCKDDVLTTYALYLKQRKAMTRRKLWPCYHTKALLCKTLAKMELRGMHLDEERVQRQYAASSAELYNVEQELDVFTGGINHNSHKQKAEYLYDVLTFDELKNNRGPIRTIKGARKTDIDTILALTPKNEQQRLYLHLLKTYQHLHADVSKALEKFKDCVESGEYLYANFNQAIAKTHRLTSSGTKHKIQFQNLHRKFRALFKARNEGWTITNVDYAQLEFRVAAFLGDDANARADIANGVDVHTVTMDAINNAGGRVDRTGAKKFSFRPLFGGDSGTKAEKAYYTHFRNRYSGIVETQAAWQEEVINRGTLVTPTGLRFKWPNRHVDVRGRLDVKNTVCNYPIQYFSAEIVFAALINLDKRLQECKSFMVNTVHDCCVVETHPDEVDFVKEAIKQAFLHDVYTHLSSNYGIELDVPLGIQIANGNYWEEGEEEKYAV